jgi:excisionase family DNA binding protein
MQTRYLYPIPETAKLLGCGKTMVYDLIRQNKLHMVHIGRRSLVTAESLQKFLQSLKGVE